MHIFTHNTHSLPLWFTTRSQVSYFFTKKHKHGNKTCFIPPLVSLIFTFQNVYIFHDDFLIFRPALILYIYMKLYDYKQLLA